MLSATTAVHAAVSVLTDQHLGAWKRSSNVVSCMVILDALNWNVRTSATRYEGDENTGQPARESNVTDDVGQLSRGSGGEPHRDHALTENGVEEVEPVIR